MLPMQPTGRSMMAWSLLGDGAGGGYVAASCRVRRRQVVDGFRAAGTVRLRSVRHTRRALYPWIPAERLRDRCAPSVRPGVLVPRSEFLSASRALRGVARSRERRLAPPTVKIGPTSVIHLLSSPSLTTMI